jgi:hypothetical protein
MGLATPDTVEATIEVKINGDGMYGNPAANSVYWVKQSYQNCALMAEAMAIGQLRGSVALEPSENEIVNYAKITDSAVMPGRKIYLNENIDEGTDLGDVPTLLEKYYNVNATFKKYTTPAEINGLPTSVATQADGQRALLDVEAALAQGNAVIVGVNAQTLWAAVQGSNTDTPEFQNPNHGVVVIGVDTQKGIVYLNDSGPDFQGQTMVDKDGNLVKKYPLGEPVTIGAFLSAWQTSSFTTIVVSNKTTV